MDGEEVTSSDGNNNFTQVQCFPVFNVKDEIFKEICNEVRKKSIQKLLSHH